MKNKIIDLLKIFLILIILILLIIMSNISLNFFQRLFVGNDDYMIISSNISSIYSIIVSIVISFLVFLLLFKDRCKKYVDFIFKFEVIIPIIVVLFIGYLVSIFNVVVVYNEKIEIYNFLNLKGKLYEYSDIESADTYIHKGIYGYKVKYEIKIDSKKYEILDNSKDFGLELHQYDYIVMIDKNIRKLNINVDRNDKYISNFDNKNILSLFKE